MLQKQCINLHTLDMYEPHYHMHANHSELECIYILKRHLVSKHSIFYFNYEYCSLFSIS